MHIVYEQSFGIIPLIHQEDEWKIFIILHKQGNHWGFPKGKANADEDPKESAVRELKEETNLQVEKFFSSKPIIDSYTFYRKGEKVEKTVTYFPAIVSGAFLLQPEEIRDGKWASFEEAKQILTFEESKNICKKIQLELTQK